MFKNLLSLTFTICILLLSGCTGSVVSAPPSLAESEPEQDSLLTGTLVLGDVDDEPTKKIPRFQRMADYLVPQLAEYGIGQGKVKIAPDLETMTEWIANGEVDVYFDSPFPALSISAETGAKPILRRWKGDVAQYNTAFFARADSGLTSLADLEGKMVAFQDNYSTSGYMLPAVHIIEGGFNLVEKETPEDVVMPDEVGFVFSDADPNTIQWVINGRVAAGATDTQNLAELPEETQADLIVLAETEPAPRQVVIVRKDLEPALVETIKILLIEMNESEEGLAVLEEFKTSQFDEFPEGADVALARMREMYEVTTSR